MAEDYFEWELALKINSMSGDGNGGNGNTTITVENLRKSEVLELFKVVKDHIQTQITTGVKKPLIIEVEEDEDDNEDARVMQKYCINTDVLAFWVQDPSAE
jgi:hypothetical protein